MSGEKVRRTNSCPNASPSVELRLAKGRRQRRRRRRRQVEPQICLQSIQRFARQLRVHRLHELRLRHVERRQIRRSLNGEVGRPVDRRIQRPQFGNRHLVISLVRIAPLHASQRSLGQRSLNSKNGVRIGFGLPGRFPRHPQQLHNVRRILLPDLLALRICLQVVIAVRKPKSSRANLRDHGARIGCILLRAGVEEVRASKVVVNLRDRRYQRCPSRQAIDPSQRWS